PYTAITGSYSDTEFTARTGKTRILPVYGKPNTERFDPQYQLDIRLSYKDPYKWGYISWYIEAIGAVSSRSQQYQWDYRYEYSSDNPKIVTPKNTIAFLPNFGVEVKF
ncbi:MAG: hypothetical protein ACRCUT_01940, partial [Spirochaetota bacterium]